MYIYIYIIAIATAISYYILFFNIIAIMNYISWWHPASKNEKKKKKKLEEEPHLPSDLKKYRRDLVASPKFIRDRNNFSADQKANKQLQSGVRSRRTSCTRSSSSRVKGTGLGAGSATCSSWRTSGARSSSSASLTLWCTWHSIRTAPAQELALRSASAANTKARRMKLQDNVRAVVVKEVQLRDPVTRSLRVRCTAAPAPAPAPVALPSTAHCPASGDHPPTATRPPPTRTAIRAAAARRPTDYGARARRPQRGHY